jgi:WD40 repeat protein
LISIGVQGENNLAIWDLQTGLVVRSCLIKNTTAVNTISVDPYVNSGDQLQFALAGNQGLFNIYRFDLSTAMLQAYEVDNVSPEFQSSDFTSLAFTHHLNA